MIAPSVTLTSRGSERTSEFQRSLDVFVVPERRRQGVATTLTRAAEDEVRRHGWDRISLSVSARGNDPAWRLYASLGYRSTGRPPVRVHGTIPLRGRAVEVDDTLEYLERLL